MDSDSTSNSASIDCWVACEKRPEELRRIGYERLVETLSDILGNAAVMDLRSCQQLRERIETRLMGFGTDTLLVVGHLHDLEQVDFRPLAQIEQLNVLEVDFTTAEAVQPKDRWKPGEVYKTKHVPYCSLRELSVILSSAKLDDFPRSQGKLNELIEAHRTEAHKSLLDPLLALAVLADGFVVACPKDASEWFRPGIEAALESSPALAGDSVTADKYWTQLAEGGPAVDRLRGMLEEPANATPGFAEVMTAARTLWPNVAWQGDQRSQATLVYRSAWTAVKTAWEALTSKEGEPLDGTEIRGLVEAASIGFQVLAAGYL